MLTVKEVADFLRLDEYTIRVYLREGRIKGIKLGRAWRISKEELDRFVKGE